MAVLYPKTTPFANNAEIAIKTILLRTIGACTIETERHTVLYTNSSGDQCNAALFMFYDFSDLKKYVLAYVGFYVAYILPRPHDLKALF